MTRAEREKRDLGRCLYQGCKGKVTHLCHRLWKVYGEALPPLGCCEKHVVTEEMARANCARAGVPYIPGFYRFERLGGGAK